MQLSDGNFKVMKQIDIELVSFDIVFIKFRYFLNINIAVTLMKFYMN